MRLSTMVTVAASIAVMLGAVGCEKEGTAERAGQRIDQAADRAGEKIDKAGDKAAEKIDAAKDAAANKLTQ